MCNTSNCFVNAKVFITRDLLSKKIKLTKRELKSIFDLSVGALAHVKDKLLQTFVQIDNRIVGFLYVLRVRVIKHYRQFRIKLQFNVGFGEIVDGGER